MNINKALLTHAIQQALAALPPTPVEKKPYTTPKLKHLGAVADLTAAGSCPHNRGDHPERHDCRP